MLPDSSWRDYQASLRTPDEMSRRRWVAAVALGSFLAAMLLAGLIAIAIGSGCGEVQWEPLVPRDGSPTFLELHGVSQDAAERAAAMWEPLGVRFVLDATEHPAQVLPVHLGGLPAGKAGVFTPIPFEVRLRASDDWLTLAHELGHALGLQHVEGCALMSPTACSPTLTAADLDEFARTQF